MIEALRLAWTCQGCGKCTGICPVARGGLGYSPRRLIQKSTQGSVDAALLDRALFACLACDRCASVCPSGISISDTMLALRALALERGRAGVPAHAGVIQTLMRMMADQKTPQDRLWWLDDRLETAASGDVLYFVGCAPYFEPLFAGLGTHPLRTARNAIRLLNAVGVVPVLLPDERCCGHDLLWLGDSDRFARLARHNVDAIRTSGAGTVVFSCPEGLRTFRRDYPNLLGPLGFESLHITEFLTGRAERQLELGRLSARATFHDPCRLGRHLGVYDPPRDLLDRIDRLELVEMVHSRELATCCGGTCWTECGPAVKQLQKTRLAEAQATGADRLVTACPKCDIHLRCAQVDALEEPSVMIQNIVDLLTESAGIQDTARSGAEHPDRQGGRPDAR